MTSQSKRRILILEPAGSLWGSERALLDLCGGLKRDGWEIGLCCPPDTPIISAGQSLFAQIFPTFVAGLHRKSRWRRITAAWNLFKAIRRFRPALIYVNQAGATKIALLAARLTGLDVVTHTRLQQDVQYLRPMLNDPRLQHVICVSDYICRQFTPDTAMANGSISRIYDCYESRQPDPDVSTKLHNVIICAGRIESNKGQDLLVGALAQAVDHIPELSLALLGSVDANRYTSELERQMDRLNVSGRVKFVGFQNNIWPYFSAADFLVCPSHVEALGRVIFEAWDAGIVPIAFRGSGGPAETLSSSNAGILYDRQEPDCIADAIVTAYQLSRQQRQAMVTNGRTWMRHHLDPDGYADEVSAIFTRVLDRAPQTVS